MSCIQCSRARCRDTVIRTGRNQVLKVALIIGVLVQGAHYPESGRSRLRCRPVCGRPSHHLHHWGLRGDSRRFHGDGRHEASPGTAMRLSVGLRPRPPGDSNTGPGSPGPRTRRTHPRSPCGRGVKVLPPSDLTGMVRSPMSSTPASAPGPGRPFRGGPAAPPDPLRPHRLRTRADPPPNQRATRGDIDARARPLRPRRPPSERMNTESCRVRHPLPRRRTTGLGILAVYALGQTGSTPSFAPRLPECPPKSCARSCTPLRSPTGEEE